MSDVRIQGLSKYFDTVAAVNDVTLHVSDGEFVSLLGPSGCGKTTTMRCVAGLERPDAGDIFIGERRVTHLAPRDRDVALVFQSYALYPHMKTGDNIGYPLKLRGMGRAERDEAVRETAFLFNIHELLSNIDALLRVTMRAELKRLQQQLGITTLFVTHDQTEAMTLSDRIAVMEEGIVQQVGKPLEIYHRPANIFVARFVGSPPMNFFSGQLQGVNGSTRFVSPTLNLPASPTRATAGHVV